MSDVYAPAARLIGANEDLIGEILPRLPVESLLRFKSVSKLWLSHISDPQFCRTQALKNPSILIPRGLYFYNSLSTIQKIHTVSVSKGKTRFPSLSPIVLPAAADATTTTSVKFRIVQSCNGLNLFQLDLCINGRNMYCVCNLATRQLKLIPLPNVDVNEEIITFNLVFDPLVDPHFKVVCVKKLESYRVTFLIFSSESDEWKDTNVVVRGDWLFGPKVYFNGAIYWFPRPLFSNSFKCHCFDVEAMELTIIPMPLSLKDTCASSLRYFGEFNGHLHLVYIPNGIVRRFNVFEFDVVTLKWFVKYRVHIDRLITPFPQIVVEGRNKKPEYAISILSVVRGENEDDSALVMTIPGSVVSYNFKSKKVEVLSDLPLPNDDIQLRFQPSSAHSFVATLHPL